MNNAQDDDCVKQLNIGCGPSPIRGWRNYDNNFFIYIAMIPFAKHILARLPFIPAAILDFMDLVNAYNIKFADASKRIPGAHDSVHTIYSSHMLEHLDQDEAIAFLKEARRVLVKGGIIRIVVPNLDCFIQTYLQDNDSHSFVKHLCLVSAKPKTLIKKLQYLIMGHGWHHVMYNEHSLIRLIADVGFINISILKPGDTMISNSSGLNLWEHAQESIYLEAYK